MNRWQKDHITEYKKQLKIRENFFAIVQARFRAWSSDVRGMGGEGEEKLCYETLLQEEAASFCIVGCEFPSLQTHPGQQNIHPAQIDPLAKRSTKQPSSWAGQLQPNFKMGTGERHLRGHQGWEAGRSTRTLCNGRGQSSVVSIPHSHPSSKQGKKRKDA